MANKSFAVRHGLVVANNVLYAQDGKLAINSTSNTYNLTIIGTDGVLLPSGNTTQRPTGANGVIRYNSESNSFEGYSNGAWGSIGGGSGGDITNAYVNATFLKLAGGVLTGNVTVGSNTVVIGNSIGRFVFFGNTGDFSGTVTTSGGFFPTSNSSGFLLGAAAQRFVIYANTANFTGEVTTSANVYPSSNAVSLGQTNARWVLIANTGDFSGAITTRDSIAPVSNSVGITYGAADKRINLFANSVEVSSSINPISNTTGTALGSTTQRWVLIANTGTFSGAVTTTNGFYPVSNSSGQALGLAAQRFVLFANTGDFSGAVTISGALTLGTGLSPTSNTSGQTLGSTTQRWVLTANTGDFSGAVTISGALNLVGALTVNNSVVPFSNTVGTTLGSTTQRWVLNANTGDFSSTLKTDSLGVGTSASGVSGEIRATNNITAYYSDERLKKDIKAIKNALNKIKQISGVYYKQNETAAKYGYKNKKKQVGVIAQQIQSVLPEAVSLAPFDTEFVKGKEVSKSGENYLTVLPDKIIPLLIEGIKELADRIERLEE